ncbi:MAG: DUF4390 domain-containing protein [Burkholderiales bacterium]
MTSTMVSITPSCKKSRPLRALAALAIFCSVIAAAAAEGIFIKSADLSRSGDEYLLEANFEVGLTATLEEALNRGLPLHFALEFELIKPRWYTLYLWNKTVLEYRQNYQLSYNALTRQYRLSQDAVHQNFDTLEEALGLLGSLDPRAIAHIDRLDEGAVYEAAIRLELDVTQLPKPFRINAIASRDWNLSSDWYRWTLTR